MKIHLILFLLLLSSCQYYKTASQVQEHRVVDSVNSHFVYDNIGLLNEEQKNHLTNKLNDFFVSNNVEIFCILTTTSKSFESEMDYTDYLLGIYDEKEVRNLVLIVLFKSDRRIFIRTNKNTNKRFPDKDLQEVIDIKMTPNFKAGNFFEGLDLGIDELIKMDKWN